MGALANDRNTPTRAGELIELGAAASKTFFAGGIVALSAAGYATPGAVAATLIGLGRCEERVTSSAVAGAEKVKIRTGVFRYANSASGDLIAADDIGKPCYIVDDQTVALTDNSAARSIAGFIHDVDAQGVWVRFDAALARAYVAGVSLPA
ncbi:MAG: hypothetical protein V4808_07190 [Pseudomonadota bacterium]